MKKYFYRLKNTPMTKGIYGQKLHGYRITKKWKEFPEKLDLSGMEDFIEEKTTSEKEGLKEDLLDRGFPEEEVKGKTIKQMKELLDLDKEIEDGTE